MPCNMQIIKEKKNYPVYCFLSFEVSRRYLGSKTILCSSFSHVENRFEEYEINFFSKAFKKELLLSKPPQNSECFLKRSNVLFTDQ